VDRYSSRLLLLVLLIVGLNVVDALFTMMVLDTKGIECNPVVDAVIAIHGDDFWIWKFFIVSICAVLLCLHSKFRMVKIVLIGICMIFIVVVAYEISLLVYQ